jgi:hypothetical protein
VPSYLVETYLARGSAGMRAASERRARSAAEELTREGTRVRFEGSTYVPEDEICFFTFEASSAREAALLAHRSGLDALRVVEADSSGSGASTPVGEGHPPKPLACRHRGHC